MIRLFDVVLAFFGLLVLSPVFIVIAFLIKLSSKGPVFFKQTRVGKLGILFSLLKFRTMVVGSEAKGQLTVGNHDARVSSVGLYLRAVKLDEFPQLINVIKGEMSIVGPRPEVPKYVALYTTEQRKILEVRPGITDLASIVFANENKLLAQQTDPESYYIKQILPEKIRLNMQYIEKRSLSLYFQLIGKTIIRIFTR